MDENVVYLIECDKERCKMKYIGETHKQMKDRFEEHKNYVKQKKFKYPTGEHFNLPGHSVNNMKIIIMEKVKETNVFYRKEREHYLIRKFNTFYQGMNKAEK